MDINVTGSIELKADTALLAALDKLTMLYAPDTAGSTTVPNTIAAQAQQPAPAQVVSTAPVAQPVQTPDPAPVSVPTSAPAYTVEQLQAAIGPLLSAGRHVELQGILTKYGVSQLTAIPQDQLGLVAADLRALGAQI